MRRVDFWGDMVELNRRGLLSPLLRDKRRSGNIRWGTERYHEMYGKGFGAGDRITPGKILDNDIIRPSLGGLRPHLTPEQKETRKSVLKEHNQDNESPLVLPDCGEALLYTNRYNCATGESIPRYRRNGLFQFRVKERAAGMLTDHEFVEETLEVLKSLAGYDTDGDMVLKARINLLMTFADALKDYWIREPSLDEYRRAAEIITDNIFQLRQ